MDGKRASAHDLRRTFGTRWARKVMPAVLQRLMRHANIGTTMQYYVDLAVDEMADDLWKQHAPDVGNISGNIAPEPADDDEGTDSVSPGEPRACYPK